MGDPVTTGILVGAAMGGGSAAIKGQDPLKAALIGGATGGIGGGLAGGFGGAAGAGTGGGFAGGGYGSVGTAGQTASGSGGLFGGSGGMFGGSSGMGGTGNIFGQGGTLSQVGQGLGVYNQASQAFGGNEQPMQMAPAGQIQRGQIQPMDYMSLLNPQNQSVMRPQPISLL